MVLVIDSETIRYIGIVPSCLPENLSNIRFTDRGVGGLFVKYFWKQILRYLHEKSFLQPGKYMRVFNDIVMTVICSTYFAFLMLGLDVMSTCVVYSMCNKYRKLIYEIVKVS